LALRVTEGWEALREYKGVGRKGVKPLLLCEGVC